jgi:hypothetical protein
MRRIRFDVDLTWNRGRAAIAAASHYTVSGSQRRLTAAAEIFNDRLRDLVQMILYGFLRSSAVAR